MLPYQVAHVAIGKSVGLMTGSNLVRNGENELIINGMKASKKFKAVRVVYNPGADLFDMVFVAKRSLKEERIEDLYVDQLREVFEQKTGLYATL